MRRRGIVYSLVLGLALTATYALTLAGQSKAQDVPTRSYADLIRAAEAGQVKTSTLQSDGQEIDWSDTNGNTYKTYINPSTRIDSQLAKEINLDVKPPASSNIFLQILPNILFLLIIGSFMWFMFRQVRRRGSPPQ